MHSRATLCSRLSPSQSPLPAPTVRYEELLEVLDVTGLSQIAFAEESAILCKEDPISHYRERIFPREAADGAYEVPVQAPPLDPPPALVEPPRGPKPLQGGVHLVLPSERLPTEVALTVASPDGAYRSSAVG